MPTFAHIIEAEEHAAAEPNLTECPECGDRMSETSTHEEKICHGCGHRQKILTQKLPDHIAASWDDTPVDPGSMQHLAVGTTVTVLEPGSLFGESGTVTRVGSAWLGWPAKATVQIHSPGSEYDGQEFQIESKDLKPIPGSAMRGAKLGFLPALLGLMGEGGMAGLAGEAGAGGMLGAEGGATGNMGMIGQLMGHAMNGQSNSQGSQSNVPIEPGAPGALGAPGSSMSIAPVGVVGRQAGRDFEDHYSEWLPGIEEGTVCPDCQSGRLLYVSGRAGLNDRLECPDCGRAFLDAGEYTSFQDPGYLSKLAAGAFGEEEVGLANKNRGDNSDPDQASSSGADAKERGDSPEQLKDITDGRGGLSPDQHDQGQQFDGAHDLQGTAVKAFQGNLPLVIEFAFSDKSGMDHPILKALDEILEQAYPGYKDGSTFNQEGESGSPTEKMEQELGQDLGSDKEKDPVTARRKLSIPGTVGVGYGVPDATAVTPAQPGAAPAAAPCQACGQPHPAGTPCPPPATATNPVAPGNPMQPTQQQNMLYRDPVTPPQPQAVVTHVEEPVILSLEEARDIILEGRHSEFEHDNPQLNTQIIAALERGEIVAGKFPDGRIGFQRTAESVTLPDEQEHFTRDDPDEHHDNRYEDGEENDGWYEDWEGDSKPEQEVGSDSPWVDDKGEPLHEGQEYELHSSQYAIPDRVTVEAVTPDKVTVLIHSGEVDYRDEVTLDEVHDQGLTFQLPTTRNTDSESGFEMEGDNPQPPAQQPHQHLNLEHPQRSANTTTYRGYTFTQNSEGTIEIHHPEVGLVGAAPDLQEAKNFVDDDLEDHSSDGKYAGSIDAMDTPANKLPNCTSCGENPFTHGPDGSCPNGQGSFSTDEFGPPDQNTQGREVFSPPPVRPGMDALPQTTDLSTPPTKQGGIETSWEDPLTGETHEYTGSFRGDSTDNRSWLLESSPVDVDPTLMAKLAGKDFSPREQRELIDEEGEARNIGKLSLEGTHYMNDEGPGLDVENSLW